MKRKIGLIVGYSGEGYRGLQWNKETHTIERAIMGVLRGNGLVTELNAVDPQKIDMKSSSRTDKGVHASFNVIQAKICREPTSEIEEGLRTGLAQKGVHLYKMVRLPKKFIGHRTARSRIYRYSVPTYFLKESDYTGEYLKRAGDDRVVGSSGRPEGAGACRDPGRARENGHSEGIYGTKCGPSASDAGGGSDSTEDEDGQAGAVASGRPVRREYTIRDLEGISGYRSPDIAVFREIMERYAGTHDFANFTARANSKGTRRFIKSISVSGPVIVDGIEYADVTIHGQSFLLHQIRKMVSFAVLNCRYARDKAAQHFARAFSRPLHIPKAPSQYLFLSCILFDDYNRRAAERIEIDDGVRAEFERRVLQPLLYRHDNLYEWLRLLDAVRFHHENFEIFK